VVYLILAAIAMQLYSETGGMMRKIFVSAAATATLCSLALSVTPALGFHEFLGDRTSSETATSNTTQTFQLGPEDWVECAKFEIKYTPEIKLSSKLKVKLANYTTCVYNHPSESLIVQKSSTLCNTVTLKSSALKETFTNEFAEGLASQECNLQFETTSCIVEIKEPAPQRLLTEFQWRNKDTIVGHYESLLLFRLEGMEYTIKTIKGTGCGSSGTNGEYNGSIPLDGEIIK
jgi:hypothetical protein